MVLEIVLLGKGIIISNNDKLIKNKHYASMHVWKCVGLGEQ